MSYDVVRVPHIAAPLGAVSVFLVGIVSAGFVGGINLASTLATAWIVAILGIVRGHEPFTAVLGGMLASIFSVFFLGAALVPILRRTPIISEMLFRSTSLPEAFEARTYSYDSLNEAKLLTPVLIGLIPFVVAATVLWWHLRRAEVEKGPPAGSSAFASVVMPVGVLTVPLVIGALRKLQSPYEYLASTMSGDGRNFFLKVQDIRVTSAPTSFGSLRGQGDFLPSLGAHFSSGMGANGLMDVRDQYAIASVYLLMSGLIVASVGALAVRLTNGFTRATEGKSGRGTGLVAIAAIAIAPTGLVLATFSPLVNEVFRSGFLSQYGAFAFMAAFLAVGAARSSDANGLVLQLLALILLTATYPLAAGVVALVFLRNVVGYALARLTPSVVLLAATVTVAGVLATRPWSFVIESVRSRVSLPGAIDPSSTYFWIPFLVVSLVVIVFGRRSDLRVVEDIALVILSGVLINELILFQRQAQGLEGWGYYGEKNIYITNFGVAVLLAGLVVALVIRGIGRATATGGLLLKRPTVPVVFGVTWGVLIWVAGGVISSPQGVLLRQSNWTQPRAGSVEVALSTWPAQDVMYLDSSDPGEARMLNFWMPYSWRGPGWNWAYLSSPADPVAACETLSQRPAQVLSFDADLVDQVQALCDPRLVGE